MNLPDHICEDPRPGPRGGRFALITCLECGKVVRRPMGALIGLVGMGQSLPKYCSRKCYAAAQRRGQ
jgi:hypothetical protein